MRQLTIQSFFMMIDKDRKGWVTVEELEAEIRRNNSLRMNSTQVIIIVFLTSLWSSVSFSSVVFSLPSRPATVDQARDHQ